MKRLVAGFPGSRGEAQGTSRTVGRTARLASVAGIVAVASGLLVSARGPDYPLYYVATAGMLLLAGAFGAGLEARTGLRMTLLLATGAAAAATLALPDVERQFDDGAFWLGIGWAFFLGVAYAAFAVGAFLRALTRAIVATR